MNIITIDFETFYDRDFSLSKITTEEYVRSELFETIGVAVKINDGETQWFSGTEKETWTFLQKFDWGNSIALAHNAVFDMAILNWRYGISPKKIADTLSMARAIHGTEVGGSLAVLSQHYQLGEKGTEVINALGKRRIDFSDEDLSRYAGYCINDVDLTYRLFGCLAPAFPVSELNLIDLTIRMFTEPVLELDTAVLRRHLQEVQDSKAKLMEGIEESKDMLMSNPQFAELLRSYGVEPPMKVSPTTGKETYAFSKTDEEFKALLEHDNEMVQALVAARLGVKSTIEETRTQRFIEIAGRGTMPIPLRYYAAHTGRWGGDDKVNMQNLPRSSPLKRAILAPAGYMMIDSDSSQIEARTLAWLAEQNDLVEAFDKGEDVYKVMASSIYGKPVSDITKDERFVGKTTILGCISEGTLVLSDSGWKPIEQVSLEDKLWDGKEWVCHHGLQDSGIKETLNLCGIWLTPDHKVWSGTQWLEAQYLAQDENTRCQALGTAAENLPLQAMFKGSGEVSKHSSLDANADPTSTALMYITSKTSKAHAAHFAPKLRHMRNGTGFTRTQCRTTTIEPVCSTDSHPLSQDAMYHQIEPTPITEVGVYVCTKSGEKTEPLFSRTYRRLAGGTSRSLKWTESTSTETTNPETYDSSHEVTTSRTNVELQTLRRKLQTYDLAYAGPRNRYTVLTEQGPMIVHNCGYGMGATKFRAQLKNFGVDLPQEECERIITVYRQTYPTIPMLWREAGNALLAIANGQTVPLGRAGVLDVEGTKGIRLPNGLYIKYPNLRRWTNDAGKEELVYDTKKGKAVIPNRIYGGKVIENVCQALARIAIGEQMLLIAKKYRVVMTVHDAIACIVPTHEAQTGQEFVEMAMRIRPKWAPDLPLNCESGVGRSYGDC
jgi:DNA polymerase I-like protein with 3'-5' exonuclease and polymerase domains|nr:MAG TPA: DNA polymerase I [Caudoviricetes sp.]